MLVRYAYRTATIALWDAFRCWPVVGLCVYILLGVDVKNNKVLRPFFARPPFCPQYWGSSTY